MAVYSGKYDVGLIREGTLNILMEKVDLKQIRILAHSRWYPGWLYAARRGLDPAVVEKIKQALLALNMNNPEHKPILEKAGFIAVIPVETRISTRSGAWLGLWNPMENRESVMEYAKERARAMPDTIGSFGIMRFLTRLPFRRQIILGITAVLLVFGVLLAVLVSRMATNAMLEQIKRRGLGLGLSLDGHRQCGRHAA